MKLKNLLAVAGLTGALSVGTMIAFAGGGGGGGGFGGGGGGGGFGGGGGGFGGGGPGGGGGGFGGGNFDPAQFQQQMQQRIQEFYREQLEVKDDTEWKVIGEKVQKVQELQSQAGFGGGANLLRAAARRTQNNNNNGAQDQGGQGQQGGRRRNNNQQGGMATFFGGQNADPEGEALQKAIDADASTAELKAAIAKYVEARKQKQAKLEAAQAELRKLLTVRQEAIAFSLGLL